MKRTSNLAVLATASMLVLSVSCADKYKQGFDAGKKEGYEEGYADGEEKGFNDAKEYFASADYNDGFNDGKTAGITIGYASGKTDGYTQGYNVGKGDGYSQGYSVGKSDGYRVGFSAGYDDGDDDGYDRGFLAGYDDGDGDGYDRGFLAGYDDGDFDGYARGFDAGWDDALGLSVGKSGSLRGYSNLLSMAHNDIFDYSKIAAPKQTKRGVLVSGSLLMSETSLTNKDTLKRVAVVEQYLVTEMAKQVKSKFGLSSERSMKIAKASNHFRKYASKRALTAEDTNAYATEIIGASVSELEHGYEQSMKGDISGLNSVLEKAAQKNEISPEKMSQIVTELFI